MTVLRSGSATDVGRLRKANQDVPLEASNLFAVADGMGGHAGGEVAARVAVDALLAEFSREPTMAGLRHAFSRANRAVWQEGQDNEDLRGMGTTLTAMALVGGGDGRDTLALANVGDSRAYVYSDGQIKQITDDHSLAEERMRHGEMTEAEAAVHPQRHILTRVLGNSPDVETDMWELNLRAGDRVILCSDGLSNELAPRDLVKVLSKVEDPAEAARQLVAVANAHGGADNITAVVVDVIVGEDSEATSSTVLPLVGRNATTGMTAVTAAATSVVPAARVGTGYPTIGDDQDSGLTRQVQAVPRQAPDAEAYPSDITQPVPVARSTVRAAAARRSTLPAAPQGERRGDRRRRMGIPRRVTFRVFLFVVLVLAIFAGAFAAVRWYAYENWFVTIHGTQVVVDQGRPGGVLWFKPKVVDQTGVTTAGILPASAKDIRSHVQEPSLADAKRYVHNQHEEFVFLKLEAAKQKKAAAAAKKAEEAAAAAAAAQAAAAAATTTTTTAPTATTTPTTAAVTPTTAAP